MEAAKTFGTMRKVELALLRAESRKRIQIQINCLKDRVDEFNV